jgi:hypothetical protein
VFQEAASGTGWGQDFSPQVNQFVTYYCVSWATTVPF